MGKIFNNKKKFKHFKKYFSFSTDMFHRLQHKPFNSFGFSKQSRGTKTFARVHEYCPLTIVHCVTRKLGLMSNGIVCASRAFQWQLSAMESGRNQWRISICQYQKKCNIALYGIRLRSKIDWYITFTGHRIRTAWACPIIIMWMWIDIKFWNFISAHFKASAIVKVYEKSIHMESIWLAWPRSHAMNNTWIQQYYFNQN